ncbi:MAG TPA: hypothetical protein PLX16_06540 [Exilispira sp.]|nr:hypothetical protein [Exilispira sp.]
MKSKSFFIKFIPFFLLFILFILDGCSTFSPVTPAFDGVSDKNYLDNLYPQNQTDNKTQFNESYSFCGFFTDSSGFLYGVTIELSKLTFNNITFWLYDAFILDYTKVQMAQSSNESQEKKPTMLKLSATSINPMSQYSLSDSTISIGKSKFSWKNHTLLFQLVDKKNKITVKSKMYQSNNFTTLGSPTLNLSNGKKTFFFTSTSFESSLEFSLTDVNKEKFKKNNLNGYGVFYRSFGPEALLEYEFHYLNFNKIKIGANWTNPPEQFINKSYIILYIPKTFFYYVLELQIENNKPVFSKVENIDIYNYSTILKDKNRRYPMNFSILIDKTLLKFNPLALNPPVQFFTHDSWFRIEPIFDSSSNLLGIGFSNLYEYSRMITK